MDDDAVSPVIGVILMVAVTVVLAAVVFVLVSETADGGDPPFTGVILAKDHPDTLTAGTTDNLVLIEHRGGDGCADSDGFRVRLSNDTGRIPVAVSKPAMFCVGDRFVVAEDGTDVEAGTYKVQVHYLPTDQLVAEDLVSLR